MSHAIVSVPAYSDVSHDAPPPLGLPWWVPRTNLTARLDRAVSGRITVVSAPSGWGKTVAVASWAGRSGSTHAPIWFTASSTDADPEMFWESLHRCLLESSDHPIGPVSGRGSPDSQRSHALTLLGKSVRGGGRRVLIIDNFPTGDVGALGREVELVLDQVPHGLALVVISRGEPALAVQRHHVAGELTRITTSDLAMDWREVAEVLDHHGVDSREFTARAVERHTAGWACGVRLSALALRDTETFPEAMLEADRATVDYLTSEVLERIPSAVRELLVQTSMVAEVSQDLARTVVGSHPHEVTMADVARTAFVDVTREGTWRPHPLLRRAAAAELAHKPLAVRLQVVRRAAQWHVDHDQFDEGISIATSAQDWSWVGRTLVTAHVVPQILAGSATGTVESALAVAAVSGAEPVLKAALLLREGDVIAAEAVLALPAVGVEDTHAARLSAIFVRLAAARARGDLDTGNFLAARAQELMPQLGIDQQRALSTMIEAHLGALQANEGQLDRAEATLRQGVDRVPAHGWPLSASLDCVAQLALLDAFHGNLRAADRQATSVLKGDRSRPDTASVQAHLALAWVHLERAEHAPARQHLDRASERGGGVAGPWFETALRLAQARLLIATDRPEAALRFLVPTLEQAKREDQSTWSVALLTVCMACALVKTGEPQRALDVIAQAPAATLMMNGVLTARALIDLGDFAGAQAALAAVAVELDGAPLGVQVEYWLLEARLSEARHGAARTQFFVDRALRESERERMRLPLASSSEWMRTVIERDPTLRRAHGGFLTSLQSPTYCPAGRGTSQSGQLIVETLTVREAQVLSLIAQMCSTEEIAAELYLSVNTVKTYVRGILRKLGVNRRVDAVRRGRELGLC